MYNIEDRHAAVMRVQRYLHAIREGDALAPPIDGVYGEQTREAVLAYQREKGLPQSGTVDFLTFMRIYEEYRIAMEAFDREGDLDFDTPLVAGARSEQVRRLNSQLSEHAAREQLTPVGTENYYGERTGRRVAELQARFGHKVSAEADRAFLRRLTRELRAWRELSRLLLRV